MGWVEDEFLEHEAYERLTPRLWDTMRDNSGGAVLEFNARMGTRPIFELRDCTARGAFCLRVQRVAEQANIEVFLDTKDRSLKSVVGSGKVPLHICNYRTSTDRSTLEFFREQGSLSADEVCRIVLREFMFMPFPMVPKL